VLKFPKWGQEAESEMSTGFRDLVVWQKSMQLAVEIYELTEEFPREEIYGLTSQMRRSAVSIPSNIAEGQGRANPAEFRQFISIARGSNCELQTQLELALALKFGNAATIDLAQQLSEEVRKMLYGLLSSLKQPSKRTNLELRTLN
jgi:four helix bundle protein